MIRTVYALAGRAAHRIATPLLRMYGRNRTRARALVVNDQNEILLVRSWFGRQRWSLPGGGIRRGELPSAAAAREVFEETEISIDEQKCKPLGEFENGDSAAPFTVNCQMIHIQKQLVRIAPKRRLEILDAAWFPLKHMPAKRSPTVDRALALYKSGANAKKQ